MKVYLERFRAWWSARAERERQMLSLGAGALALILLYLAVWEPLTHMQKKREASLAEARALAVQLETLATQAPGASTAAGVTATKGQSLLSVVDQSGKASQIGKAPSRLQPDGDNTVRLWLDDVPFDPVLRWLAELQTRNGVRVSDADIERQSGTALVKVRLTLVRGS